MVVNHNESFVGFKEIKMISYYIFCKTVKANNDKAFFLIKIISCYFCFFEKIELIA